MDDLQFGTRNKRGGWAPKEPLQIASSWAAPFNLMKFLTLRCHAHAQHEIRVYAEGMRDLIRPIVPVSVASWESTT